MSSATSGLRDRALGALYGLAVGDALGMPTQSLPRSLIEHRYGPLIGGFEPGPPDQPLAPGLPAGTVTDDTEQALLLGRLLVETGGHVPPVEWGRRLLAWEDAMRARGSLDLLGPSTRQALDQLLAGVDPAETGRAGTTNGAAMRIAPVALAVPPDDPDRLVAAVVAASQVTHDTGVALAGATAVAAAIAAGLDGGSPDDALAAALDAARRAESLGHWVAAASVPERIGWAVDLVRGTSVPDALRLVERLVGTALATQESVPAAFALASLAPDDPWTVARLGASVGGDCDTIAAMAAAMTGARCGLAALPRAAVDQVERVNRLDVPDLVDGLLALRDASPR